MKETMSEEIKTDDVKSSRLKVSHPEEGGMLGRGLSLRMDGEDLPHLKAGRAVTTEIEPGHHRLRVDNTYQKKIIEFDAQPGETIHYKIKNKVGFFGSMILGVLGAAPMYLVIERADNAESS